ncbi:MAG: ExeM/NucH family extracellular endonuclease [Xanthomonadales bacterium]|nr:ExeM/NucH family extracellular endonuclease [Xanthomonadales bacterium]
MMQSSSSNAASKRRFFSPQMRLQQSKRHFGLAFAIACAVLSSACTDPANVPLPSDICQLELPPVGATQGSGEHSPMVGEKVTVRAVVTAVMPGEGFFVHDPLGDTSPATSEGLWIADPEPPFPGELWAWRGTIAELPAEHNSGTLTALTEINGRQRCAENQTLPVAEFPLPSVQREALESMRVRLPENIQVTQAPNRYRPYTLTAASERVFSPTEMVRPGSAAKTLSERFRAASMDIALPPGRHYYRVGDKLEAVAGVYDLRDRAQLISTAAPQVSAAAGIPQAPSSKGDIRIVSMNLLNYFNGDGQGDGFPTQRGAETPEEFAQQRERTLSAVAALAPDVIAVQELENDGYGAHSAAADFVQGLNQYTNTNHWRFVAANANQPEQQLGGDDIAVGLFYRADRVQPVGASAVLDTSPFNERHRAVLAQGFRLAENSTEQADWLVASVHLKSKGSCPEAGDNANTGDGQACWAPARVAAVEALVPWLKQQAAGAEVLVLGDFNSYRMEDPIRSMARLGMVELVGQSATPPLYSYNWRGQRGTLDFAFATPSLVAKLSQANHWHINSDESDLIQQHSENTDLNAQWRRFSDHDPLYVDITVNAAP